MTYCIFNGFLALSFLFYSTHAHLDPTLLHTVYTSIFRLRDGSSLTSVDSTAIDAMKGSVLRILAVGEGEKDWLNFTRSLPDDRLLSVLLLAVAGNFTVDQSPSAIPQRCGIVVDPGTGALILRDNAVAQSVILEVLLIVSIVCLLSAWGTPRGASGGESAAK
jgi:hypothetical protein